jgi:hypothetical protein
MMTTQAVRASGDLQHPQPGEGHTVRGRAQDKGVILLQRNL